MSESMAKGPCEGCGERVEVYGSSWCPRCAIALPQYVQGRLLQMRNALISARYARTRGDADRVIDECLQAPRVALEARRGRGPS